MDTILREYNRFNTKRLSTIQELDDVSEIVHSETVSETQSAIIFRRFCSCCARDNDQRLHPVHYFAIDIGKLDVNGDVTDGLVAVEYGLL